jgi:hypothetical protein
MFDSMVCMITFQQYSYPVLDNVRLFDDEVNERVFETCKTIIDFIPENIVYPSIQPAGEGEIIFYWKAGDSSMEIDVDEEDDELMFYIRYRKDAEVVKEYHGIHTVLTDEVKDHIVASLSEFTARVDRLNPKWRELYI